VNHKKVHACSKIAGIDSEKIVGCFYALYRLTREIVQQQGYFFAIIGEE
jgi:hypothetical protein